MSEALPRSFKFNQFGIRSFRDIADQDYITARMCYRARLIPQFHWSAQQAIEKYLKGILFLNRVKAKGVRHDLSKALAYTECLKFSFSVTDRTKEFIAHLDRYGQFRYYEVPFVIRGPKLAELDMAVWELRRYCRAMTPELAESMEPPKNPPRQYRIGEGVLERIMADKSHQARESLLWQNLFFVTRTRQAVKTPVHFHAGNAPLSLHPELLDEVCEYIFIPPRVCEAYRAELQRRASTTSRGHRSREEA